MVPIIGTIYTKFHLNIYLWAYQTQKIGIKSRNNLFRLVKFVKKKRRKGRMSLE